MTLVALWWITEPIPIPVTSMVGPTLCVICGVVKMKEAFAAFANPMIFLFMGGFIIAKAMMVNGIDKRISYGIVSMRWVGDNPRRIFFAVGLACMLCSGWISNTATAAMMFPIALGLLEAIREMMAAKGKVISLKTYKYATGLMLMTAYACSIGCVLTPIGTPPNIIMLGFLDELCHINIVFFQWMIWGFAAMIVYFVIAYIILSRTSDEFLEKLFEQEVPEIADGLITVKKVVRVPGERAKVAVESYDDRIDPIGACIGVKGGRIMGIVRELRNENIDVIQWSQNPKLLIQRAMNPAIVSSIDMSDNPEEKVKVFMQPDQVNKGIGRKGVNVDLASKLIGREIEVYRELPKGEDSEEDDVLLSEFSDVIDQWIIDRLESIGCDTAKAVLEKSQADIAKRADLEDETVADIFNILKAEFED